MSANGTGGPPAGALPLDTSSRGPSIAAEFVVMFVLATITVAARIYTRVGLLTGLKTEDWLGMLLQEFLITSEAIHIDKDERPVPDSCLPLFNPFT